MSTGQSKIKNHKSPKRSLSEAQAQRLGFACKDIAEADAASGLGPNLARYFERHPRIRAAFDRGRFLANLKALASVVATVSEAAHKLGLVSGEALREMLDTDAEAGDIWSKTRLDTIIQARQSLLSAAKEGNQTAIRAVENYLREEKQTQGPAADLTHLAQKDLCELFTVSRVTLNEWQARHGLPRNADKTYNLGAVILWYKEFAQRKEGGRILPADKLRDLKAEEKQMDLAQRRGQLLERDRVLADLVQHWQRIIAAFRYKRRELAMMVHGQTVERIEDALSRFFEDVKREWRAPMTCLQLPAEAQARFTECLDLLATEGDQAEGIENNPTGPTGPTGQTSQTDQP
jgi:hypothetical protein